MKISKNEGVELDKISFILSLIDRNESTYFDYVTDEINQYQPFIMSILLGYKLDLENEQFDELSKIIVLIWEFFKEKSRIKKVKLTEQQFVRIQKRNIDLLKYLEGEQSEKEKLIVTKSDLNNHKSKSLLAGIFFRFNNQKSLIEIPWETKGFVLIGIKSLIESLEELECETM